LGKGKDKDWEKEKMRIGRRKIYGLGDR